MTRMSADIADTDKSEISTQVSLEDRNMNSEHK